MFITLSRIAPCCPDFPAVSNYPILLYHFLCTKSKYRKELSSGRGAPRDSQVVIHRNPYGVRVLGGGACSKNKRQSLPASPSGSSTNVRATRLERRMEAAQSIRTRDNVAHSQINHHQLLLGNWNILTLTGKEL